MMQLLTIVLTSLLTSLLTLAGAWFVFERYLKARYWAEVDAKADEIGNQFKQQVSDGVREGIANGLTDLRDKATKTATQTPFDILEEGMNVWFRRGRPKDQ